MNKIYTRNCPACGILLTYSSQSTFCTCRKANTLCRKCASTKRIQKENESNPWETKEGTILYLQSIAENGRVPGYSALMRIFGKLFTARIKKHGGYKSILREAELQTSTCYKASDGHVLLSYYEFLFDEFLSLNNIPHDIDGLILSTRKCRYDFKIGDLYVEIWGISDNGNVHYNNYGERRNEKEEIYNNNGLKLLSIEGKDFSRSSTELQDFFKEQLGTFGITANNNLEKYPIFNRRKIGYWCEATVAQELEKVISELHHFPTSNELNDIKRFDLGIAVVRTGGYRKYAALLGCEPQTKKYSEDYVIKELATIKNKLGHVPCDRELQSMERSDLASAIKTHGGYGHFQQLIEGARHKRPYGYWNDESNIIAELRLLMNKLGRFPAYEELGQIAKGIDKSKKGIRYFERLITSPSEHN